MEPVRYTKFRTLPQVSPRINAIGTFVFVTTMTLLILAQLLLGRPDATEKE
ncbi:hypothetical protein [Paracoccus sp. 22332]|uniref:hypothetical protein n=1 Tax=Paracoccus sp. 22332 TaxID=3453913 RepID=UPI003F87F4DB